jgi:tetratricopeptide (TPR) repeat protein
VRGRLLVWPLVILLLWGLAGQTVRWRGRLRASELVRQVQMLSVSLVRSNPPAFERLLPFNLSALRRAGDADPAAIEVPLVRGSLFLLLRRPLDAADGYRRALALEPHPEIYLHLGDALLAAGRLGEARQQYEIAVRLDPWLLPQVPAAAR